MVRLNYKLTKYFKNTNNEIQMFRFNGYKYAAVIYNEGEKISCAVYNKYNQIMYLTNKVERYTKSSLIRCIQIFCAAKLAGELDRE